MTISYITQQLRDIGFIEDEINEFYTIIKDSIEQSKDVESQIANTGNYKYIYALSLLGDNDWYWVAKSFREIGE